MNRKNLVPLLRSGGTSVVLSVDVTAGTGAADSKGNALTYTRSGNMYVWDHEGVLRKALENEVPQVGLRRVRNRLPKTWASWTQSVTSGSISISGDGLTATVTVSSGGRVYLYYGPGDLEVGNSYRPSVTQTVVSGTPTGQTIAGANGLGGFANTTVDGRVAGAVGTCTVSTGQVRIGIGVSGATSADCVMTFTLPQLEDVTGASNTAPSTYIDSATTYNANVAGVKVYTTDNGNSVNGSNLVTEAIGSTISTTGVFSPVEAAVTNDFTQPRDLSNAAWDVTAGLASRTLNATGVTGVANSATTLVEDTGTSLHWVADTIAYTTGQTVTIVGAVAKASTSPYFYLGLLQGDGTTYKRAYFNTSTGALGTADSGVTSANAVSRGNYWEVFMTVAVGTVGSSPICGVGMASADNTPSYLGASKTLVVDAMTIDVIGGQSSPILDTGGATRSAPTYTYSAPACISTAGKSWTVVAEFLVPSGESRIFQVTQDGSNYYYLSASVTAITFYSIDAVNGAKSIAWSASHTFASKYRAVVRYKHGTGFELWVNGSSRGTASTGASISRHTTLRLDSGLISSKNRKLDIYAGALSISRCVLESTV